MPAILLALLLISACDSLPGKPSPTERFILPTKITSFDVLYAQNCSGCHGADGRGGPARPLNDPVYLAVVPATTQQKVIDAGVAGTTMPPFAKTDGTGLTPEQITDLVKGMQERWGKPDALGGAPPPPYAPTIVPDIVADSARGESVYLARCIDCHGIGGRGGSHAGSIVDPSFLALASDQALWSAVVFGRLDLGMPDWRGKAGNVPMSPQEIADVVAWMASHRRPSG